MRIVSDIAADRLLCACDRQLHLLHSLLQCFLFHFNKFFQFAAFFIGCSCNVFVRAMLAGDAPINTCILIYNILNIAILYESTRFLTALADEIV